MKRYCLKTIIFSIILSLLPLSDLNGKTFEAGKGNFLLNGRPYVIKAAELHYPRIPKEYWNHRIQMANALGMNTVCLYTFWNIHEQEEGKFDFTEQNDIRKFVELCAENGLYVILRPGPYVCAEWEMGGLPWWLLKNKDIRLRENDPYFLEKVEAFEKELASQLSDLTIDNGGPIIMIQVENEYGSYGEDKEYIGKIRDILKKYYGDEILMFQCDWSSNFTLNGLDDLLWTMNFGTGADIDSQFAKLKELRPETPLMCSEFWSGWFDKWGAGHETRDARDMIAGIDEMLSKDISFSLYMTHGGTNWGHWAGANSPGYSPDVTSYDYDAPINESGNATEKFWLLRDVLEKYLTEGDSLPSVPQAIKPIKIDKFALAEIAPLSSNLSVHSKDNKLKTMEEYDMGFGSIIYSTEVPALEEETMLTIDEAHDYAQVFLDDSLVGIIDRRKGEREIKLPKTDQAKRLNILVEAMGRINFGRAIKDYKGITGSVTITPQDGNVQELTDWEVYLIPDNIDFYNSLTFEKTDSITGSKMGRMPRGIYRGTFNVTNPSDTFLDLESWGKGLVYVNGHPLGRFWEIGPQQTLYLPGPWLKAGKNEIMIIDILGPHDLTVEGLDYPVIDKLKDDGLPRVGEITGGNFIPLLSSAFSKGNGWQTVPFEQPERADLLKLEIVSTHSEGERPAIAEIYILDDKGKRLSREGWKTTASSEERSGNHTADKITDLQESTYWQASEDSTLPQEIVIDLGAVESISGLEYLPRMERDAPGNINEFKISISKP